MARKVSKHLAARRAAAARAMPDVKRVVKRHGRAAVGNCLAKIAQAERGQRKLAQMKSEVAALERRLRV